ncbi:MAG: histidine phosphatase family protein [Bacteroidetes bacterium]|jgi:broad specificity phosphatase PhoE|nr:histidine phosphatase family protein [Bacteroidota bacterium]MBT4399094.1 histidine phosphatase family protein [Bacteroidota bacterium]MBT4411767.1 histidine phosphatase family protein [Bacteroidota bacterium]
MKIMRYLTTVFVIMSLQFSAIAQDSEDFFTIYLVRHAEKELVSDNPRNPALTECGKQRAESLANFLNAVELDAIYSTNYTRTRSTAQPTAKKQELEIITYNPRELESFANRLIEGKEDVLVVGHSNTTGVLAGLLTGEEIGAFDEEIYNRIYQVVMYRKTGRLHILHTAFECCEEANH